MCNRLCCGSAREGLDPPCLSKFALQRAQAETCGKCGDAAASVGMATPRRGLCQAVQSKEEILVDTLLAQELLSQE